MRYQLADTITFTNAQGKSVQLKDTLPEYKAGLLATIDLLSGESLDAIASRPDVYGRDTEDQTYKIFSFNALNILDENFDFTRIKRIRIPT
jgi:hypothetical protein